jgi:hypothetical protein
VYNLFDNSCYLSVGTDGSRALPSKCKKDGVYVVPGALGFIDRDAFKDLFGSAVPLLRAGGQHRKIILVPLMRYVLLH